MAQLNLPDSPRKLVFRKIEQILRNDPILSTTIRPSSFFAWTGGVYDEISFTLSMAPAIRLTPVNGPETWTYPDATVGTLFINVEMLIAGYDYDDVFDLWWAVERAIYPRDSAIKLGFIRELQIVGAHDGLAEFSQPAFDPKPESNYFHCAGQIKINVRLDLNQ